MTNPVVLRFEEMMPGGLAKMKMHAKREGGDLGHCDIDRKEDSRWYREFGKKDFAETVRKEIEAISEINLARELEALDHAHRQKDKERRKKKGEKDPYRPSAKGPLREAILTASAEYFKADDDDPDPYIAHRKNKDGEREMLFLSRVKIAAFERRGLAFFRKYFPGQIRHLRLDLDEEVPHFHALIVVKVVETSKRRGKQILIQPSSNPLIRDYEYAQDVAGEFFGDIGLVRGERRAAARREAMEQDQPAPEKRDHVSPAEYRAQRAESIRQREEALQQKEKELGQRRQEVEKVLAQKQVEIQSDMAKVEESKEEAKKELAAAKQLKAKHEKERAAFEKGMDAVDEGKLVYRPSEEGDEKDGMSYGPKAPNKPEDRAEFFAPMRPAFSAIKKYARRIWRSEAAQYAHTIEADPSLIDVAVSSDPDKDLKSGGVVKVEIKGLGGLPHPVREILERIAQSAAKGINRHIGALIDRKAQEKAGIAIDEAKMAEKRWTKAHDKVQGIIQLAKAYMSNEDFKTFEREAKRAKTGAELSVLTPLPKAKSLGANKRSDDQR